MEPFQPSGIQWSGRLAWVQFLDPAPDRSFFHAFCRALSRRRINMPYASILGDEGQVHGQCVVALADEPELARIAGEHPEWTGHLEIHSGGGLLSLYPSGRRLDVIGRALAGLDQPAAPVWGVATSLSSLILLLTEERLPQVLAELGRAFPAAGVLSPPTAAVLPEGMAPPPSPGRGPSALETTAEYREARIRTYGIEKYEGLAYRSVELPPGRLGALASAFQTPQTQSLECRLFLCHRRLRGGRAAGLVMDMDTALDPWRVDGAMDDSNPVPDRTVDLLRFQGPHWGDRFGIAEAVLDSLAENRVPYQAMAFAGASVYIVLPSGLGEQGRDALADRFETPPRKPVRKKADVTGQ